MKWIISCAIAVTLAGGGATGPTAHAQPAGPSAEQRARAKRHFQRAERHKQRGDEYAAGGDQTRANEQYRYAARQYAAAYELVEHPALLFNLAQVYRLSGDRTRALFTYRRYLAAAPDGPGAQDARAYVDQLELELEPKTAPEPDTTASAGDAATSGDVHTEPAHEPPAPEAISPPRPPRPVQPAPAPAPAPHDRSPEAGAASRRLTTVAPPANRDAGTGGRGLRVAGIITASAGLAALGVGVKLGLDAKSASDDLSSATVSWTPELHERADAGRRAQRRMYAMYSVGGAALVGGVAMYFVGRRAATSDGERRLAIQPTVGDSMAGVMVWGSF